jgi:hypothetical protein
MSNLYQIHSFNHESSLDIKIISIEKAQEQTLKLELIYKSNNLNGSFSTWIDFLELSDFYNNLLKIEKTRRGISSISGESPNTFSLTIENYDSFGHFNILIILGKYETLPKPHYIGLNGSIDIGSEYLLDFIKTIGLLIDEYKEM